MLEAIGAGAGWVGEPQEGGRASPDSEETPGAWGGVRGQWFQRSREALSSD